MLWHVHAKRYAYIVYAAVYIGTEAVSEKSPKYKYKSFVLCYFYFSA